MLLFCSSLLHLMYTFAPFNFSPSHPLMLYRYLSLVCLWNYIIPKIVYNCIVEMLMHRIPFLAVCVVHRRFNFAP
ncbi:hypothetical protein Y032_0009g699 [Ancylostoma ceylanicum]|uniref:Uncharacterized protein n=1 Tax=Ancylostoma ceylanicum TaxID=53326 RepID=A0A016VJC2_9BILA|nr:hypothetical protein Y032_0009g699 [Ancylostoma ceylanicum]